MTVEPVTLEGAYVRLEPLSESHHAALCKVGLDPELWKITVEGVANAAGMLTYIRQALESQSKGVALPFATIEKSTGRVVGSTRFMNINGKNRRLEIGGTWIARPWQRTALNTEAKFLMLRHAFETLKCARVEFKTDVMNERSRQSILRIGAREEGILRRHMATWDGRMRDSVYFSILDSEWPEVKANLERKLHEREPV